MEIYEFDDLEEALALMRQRTAEANLGLWPKQREITYGSTVVRPMDGGFLVFGEVWTQEEFEANEAAYYDLSKPEDALEYAAVCRDQAEMHEQGYMLGRWYSTVEPTGEIGSAHRATCWPISREAFEEARAMTWIGSAAWTPTLWAEMNEMAQ